MVSIADQMVGFFHFVHFTVVVLSLLTNDQHFLDEFYSGGLIRTVKR